MAIPGFQEFLWPMLELVGDGRPHRLDEARNSIAERFDLTEADLADLLPSGRQARFANRVAWAKVHLSKAGLLSSPERGVFRITERGRSVLADAPARLDLAYLQRFAEFRNEDRLGLDVIYLQAKRWEHQVGRPELQRFVGALHGQRARKGIFITTSGFTREASDYVRHIDPKVVLIDGQTLVNLMIDFNLGVSVETSYEIKRVDSDFFAEE